MMEHKYKEHPFCKRLNRLMLSAAAVQGLNNRKIAADIGIPHTNLSAYKLGYAMPSVQRLLLLADYFGVSTDYLLGREGYEMEENK